MRVIHKHLHQTLKNQFMQEYMPSKVWNKLKIVSAYNIMLQQQFLKRGFKTYDELIDFLTEVEKNNELLMKTMREDLLVQGKF